MASEQKSPTETIASYSTDPTSGHLLYEEEERIATITFNRPEAMNALTPDMLQDLGDRLTIAAENDTVAVVVITGTGKAFSAGVDLKALGDISLDGGAVGEILDGPARRAINIIESMPKVVIAAVNGYCFTGALEIALACDLILASDTAKFGDTHAKWGLRPSWGMSARLPRAVGMRKAREMSFTAAAVDAQEALGAGLVNRVFANDSFAGEVRGFAETILGNSADALAAYKFLYNHEKADSLPAALKLESSSAFDIKDTEERIGQFRKK